MAVAKTIDDAQDWHSRGLALLKRGERDAAIEALTKATSLDRRSAQLHYDLGNALLDDGKIDRAISSFRRALRIDDTLAEAHNDLGAAYFQKRWPAEAEECFRKAIEHKPDHAVAYANLGAALRAQGKLNEGRRAFQRALALRIRGFLPPFLRWSVRKKSQPDRGNLEETRGELKQVAELLAAGKAAEAVKVAGAIEARYPDDADVLQVAGLAFEEARDFDSAIARTRAAIARKGDRAEYHITLARLLVRTNDHAGALEAAHAALKLEPGSAEIHATIAGVYHPWRDDLAVEAARRAIELDPASHTGHGNLAAALWGLGQLEEAERHAREAVRLKPAQVSYRTNLALICKDLGRMDDARALYQQLMKDAPDHPKLAMDLGTLATECDGDLEAARRWYRRAQEVSGEARAVLSEGLIDLLDGRFDTAWDKYELRKEVADQRYQHTLFSGFAPWDGKQTARGRLLVYGEQGLGDEVMYASMYDRLPRPLTILCDARLGGLFARSFPDAEVVAEPRATQNERVKTLKDIGAVVAAGSLGRLYRRRREDFAPHAGYLKADPAKTDAWRARLAVLRPGRKIGLSWMGGLQKTGRSRRSLGPQELRSLLALEGVQWISLQHASAAPAGIHEFEGATQDLDDLAGLISALDAVVSVCNTNVHIAGALGKEVLVMAPFVPEWRYGMSGDMLWYPSARIFRQQRYGDWDSVITKVLKKLGSG
jgi:tetratricopeptide (TPR) repeat protein